MMGFKLQGLSAVTLQNPEIDDILKEIALEGIRTGWTIESPYYKLAMIILAEGNRVHNFNVEQELTTRLKNTIIPQDIVNKYSDL